MMVSAVLMIVSLLQCICWYETHNTSRKQPGQTVLCMSFHFHTLNLTVIRIRGESCQHIITWRRWAREYHWQLAIPGRLILAPPIIGDGIGLAVLLIHWSFLRVSFPVSNIYIFVPLTSSASLSLSLSSTIVWPFNPLLCPLLWPLACPLAWIWYFSRCLF